MHRSDALTVLASQKCELMQGGCSFYPFYSISPTARKTHNVGLSENKGDFVGALDYGGDNHDARECSRSGTFGSGATGARGVFGKMPRRRQGMHQSMYLEISNQGRRVE
jgi:hypothetical protein